jgi:ornithine carbamoyltransferase
MGSTEAGTEKMIHRTTSPEEALQGADVVVTDTWYVPLLSHPGTSTDIQDLNGSRD